MSVTAPVKKRKLNRPGYYVDPEKTRSYKNVQWDRSTQQLVYRLRLKGASFAEIELELERRGITVNRTALYNQVRIAKANRAGLCYSCRSILSEDDIELNANRKRRHKMCGVCLNSEKEYKTELRNERLAKGVCVTCGKRKAEKGHTYCSRCMSYTYRHRIRRGLCGLCGKKRDPKSASMCTGCLVKNRRYVSRYRRKQVSSRK